MRRKGPVRSVEDVLKQGDDVRVRVLAIDRQGKIRLSRKAALPKKSSEAAQKSE